MQRIQYNNQATRRGRFFLLLLCVATVFSPASMRAQLQVQTCSEGGRNWSAANLVQNVLVGQGVQISNVKFNNQSGAIASNAIGTFTTGTVPTNLGLSEGIVIATGSITGSVCQNGTNVSNRAVAANQASTMHDATLAAALNIEPSNLIDCAVLEFDFIPSSDVVRFRYVFGSEEYPEYVCQQFSDAFGFFITGQNPQGGNYTSKNIALLPGSNTPVSIATVNGGVRRGDYDCVLSNTQYYVDNSHGTQIEYNGFTRVMTAEAAVVPCSTYHIKIVISDVSDGSRDSGVFLEANSLSAADVQAYVINPVNQGDSTTINEGCCARVVFKLTDPNSTYRQLSLTYGGTANQADYNKSSLENQRTLRFSPGVDTVSIEVCARTDTRVEDLESILVNYVLTGKSCSPTSTLTLYIRDVQPLRITGYPIEDLNTGDLQLMANITGGSPHKSVVWTDLRTGQTYHGTTWSNLEMDDIQQYAVCVTDSCGEQNTVCDTVATGYPPNFAIISNDDSICYGATAVLSVQGADSCDWYENSFNSLPFARNRATVAVSPGRTTTYYVKAYKLIMGRWFELERSVTVRVSEPMNMTLNLSDVAVCNGEQLTLTASGAYRYSWTNGSTWTTESTYTYLPPQASTTGDTAQGSVLVVYGEDAQGNRCAAMTVTVTVYPMPEIHITASSSEVCPGEQITLTATGNYPDQTGKPEYGALVVTWGDGSQFNYASNPVTTRSYTINSDTSFFFQVDATGRNGRCHAKDSVEIHVHNPAFTLNAVPDTVCLGDSITLEAHGGYAYRWPNSTVFLLDSVFGLHASMLINGASSLQQYTVTGQADLARCTTTRTVPVFVIAPPNAHIIEDSMAICIGTEACLRYNAGEYARRYRWLGTDFNSTGVTNYCVSPTQTRRYILQVYDYWQQCPIYDTADVYVYPVPEVSASASPSIICLNESSLITASGATQYRIKTRYGQWSEWSTNAAWNVSPTDSTDYIIQGRDVIGLCSAYDTVRVHVIQLPSLVLHADKTALCEGDSALLTATGASRYVWNNSGQATAQNQLRVYAGQGQQQYTVTGVNEGITSCRNEASVTITTFTYPTVSLTARPRELCVGDSVTLIPSGSAQQYMIEGFAPIPNEAGTTQWKDAPQQSRRYVLQGANGPNMLCRSSDSVDVVVNALPTVSISKDFEQICYGGSLTLQPRGASRYSWTSFQTLSSNVDDTVCSPTTTTTYHLFGEDAHGCRNTDSTTVTVYMFPQLSLSASDTAICAGGRITISVEGAQVYGWNCRGSNEGEHNGELGDELASTGGQLTDNDSRTDSRTFTIMRDSTICVMGYNTGENCVSTISHQVKVYPYPQLQAEETTINICNEGSAIIRVHGAYEYSLNGGAFTRDSVFTVSPSVNTTYRIQGRNEYTICPAEVQVAVNVSGLPSINIMATADTICLGDTVTLSARGGNNYYWEDQSTDAVRRVSPQQTTTYILYGETTGSATCGSESSITVVVHDYPSIVFRVDDDTVCGGDAVQLSATGNADYFEVAGLQTTPAANNIWADNPEASREYFLFAANGSRRQCAVRDTFAVYVHQLPQLAVSTSDDTICVGSRVTLQASGALKYSWSGFESLRLQATDTTIAPENTVSQMLYGEDSNGCRTTVSTPVVVHSIPQIRLSVSESAVCAGSTVTVTASGAMQYSWDTMQTFTTSNTYQYTLNSTSTIEVFGANTSSACYSSEEVQITVYDIPQATIDVATHDICIGDTLHIRVSGAPLFSWNNGAPTSVTDSVVQPRANTTYSIRALNENQLCSSSTTLSIAVHPLPTVRVAAGRDVACSVDTIAFTTSGNGSAFSWDRGRYFGTASDTNMVLRQAGDVVVLARTEYGCVDSASVPVVIYQQPNVVLTPDKESLCLGDTLHVTVSGAYKYKWAGEQGFFFDNQRDFVPADTGYHAFIATGEIDGPRCTSTDTVEVLVWPRPDLHLQATATAICDYDSLTIRAYGDYTHTFAWSDARFVDRDTVRISPDESLTYVVQSKSEHNCLAKDSVRITVWKPVISVVASDTAICDGNTLLISASRATLYSWDSTASFSARDTHSYVLHDSADFRIYGKDEHGCIASDTVHIAVYPYPTTHIETRRLAVCEGDRAHLVATGADVYQYSWQSPIFVADTAVQITPVQTSVFTVVGATSNLLCQTADSVTVVVYPLPDVFIAVSQPEVCDGDSVTLRAAGADAYSWDFGETFESVDSMRHVPTIKTTYIVWGEEHEHYCRNFDTVSVYWHAVPQLSVVASREEICEGDSVRVVVSGANYYLWEQRQQFTADSEFVTYLTATDTIRVYGDVYNRAFCGSDTSVVVTVVPLPEVALRSNQGEICLGDSIVLSASGASYYQWGYATQATEKDTMHAKPMETIDYMVRGYTANMMCSQSDTMRVIVYAPEVRLQSSRQEICYGDTITLSAAGSDLYRWVRDSSFRAVDTADYVLYVDTTIVVGGMTANELCSQTDSIHITVYPLPSPELTIENYMPLYIIYNKPVYELCRGEHVWMKAEGASFYQWPKDDELITTTRKHYFPQADTADYVLYGENFNHMCHATDTITVIVNPLPDVTSQVSATEICAGDSVEIVMSGAMAYRWHEDSAFVHKDTMRVYPTEPTQYIVCGENEHLCHNYDTILVNAYTIPVLQINASKDTLCVGDSVTIRVSGASLYDWDNSGEYLPISVRRFGPVQDTTIVIHGASVTGLCTSVDSIRIVVLSRPSLRLEASKEVVCLSDSVVLTARGGQRGVLWNHSIIFGDTTLVVYPTSDTLIHVSTALIDGCLASDSIRITLRNMPNVRLVGRSEVCLGDTVQLHATGGTLFSWGTDQRFTTLNTITIAPQHDTSIIVRGVDRDEACRNSDTLHLSVFDQPVVSIEQTPAVFCYSDSITLTVSGADSYLWMGTDTLSQYRSKRFYTEEPVEYRVIGYTHHLSCRDTATVMLAPVSAPTISVTASVGRLCRGESVTLTARGADSYAWGGRDEFGHDSVRVMRPQHDTTYLVRGLIEGTSCLGFASVSVAVDEVPTFAVTAADTATCMGDSLLLTATGAARFVWEGGDTVAASRYYIHPLHTGAYVFAGLNAAGRCAVYDTLQLRVFDLPQVVLSGNSHTICLNDTLHLTASGAPVFAWNGSAAYNGTHQWTVVPLADTSYYVMGVDEHGCVKSDTFTVSVTTMPQLHLTVSDDTVCAGMPVRLAASGADVMALDSVRGSDEVVLTAANSWTLTPMHDMTYYVYGSGATGGCTAIDSVRITVLPAPRVDLSANTLVTCRGGHVRLHASGADSYIWNDNQQATADSTLEDYPVASTTYSVIGIQGNDVCRATASLTVRVLNADAVALRAEQSTICTGDTIVLRASGAPAFAWNGTTGFSTTDTVRRFVAVRDTVVSLRGLVLNTACPAVDTVQVRVMNRPAVSLAAQSTSICIGDTVVLHASGAALYDFGGMGQYAADSVLTDVPQTTLLYAVYGTTADGLCSARDTLTITVHELPQVRLTAQTTDVCNGMSTILSATGASTYLWNGTGGFVSANAITVTPQSDSIFQVVGRDEHGCLNSAQVAITLLALPEAALVADTGRICAGDRVSFTATGGDAYAWDGNTFGEESRQNFTPWQDTTVRVVVRNGYGCTQTASRSVSVLQLPSIQLSAPSVVCAGEEVSVTAQGGATYSWNTMGAFSTQSIYTQRANEELFVKVYGKGTDGLCVGSDTIRIAVRQHPTVHIEGESRACQGSLITLSAEASQGVEYVWSSQPADATLNGQEGNAYVQVRPSESTTYYVHVRHVAESFCTSTTDSHRVVIVPNPRLTLSLHDTTVCVGSDVNILAQGGAVYRWADDNGFSSDSVHVYSPSDSRYVHVSAYTSDHLCHMSDSVRIRVDQRPYLTIVGSDSNCLGFVTMLTASTDADDFTWSSQPEDRGLYGQEHQANIYVGPATDTRYTLRGRKGVCIVEERHLVQVGPMPSSYGVSDPQTARRGNAEFTFHDLSVNALGRTWTFPDGYSTDEETFHYVYDADMDTFDVMLIAYNKGCRDTSIVSVRVIEDELWVPNTFTPGESTNNIFYTYPYKVESYHIDIYSRQGQIVFSSDDPTEGWDGKYRGHECPQGAYVWIIRCTHTDLPGRPEVKKGTVLLLR